MTTAHVGEKRALVFPVMCDAHLKIEFDDTNTSTKKGNLWRHSGPFTVEAVITPYDVNGLGHRTSGQGRLDSIKTPPSPNLSLDDHADTTSSYQSVSYFGSGRDTHKMMLFHNQYFKFFLQNTTSSNFNQPAEYKLVCEITDSTDTSSVVNHTISSQPVFVSTSSLEAYYDATALYNGIISNKAQVSTGATASLPTATATISGNLASFTNTAQVLGTATITVNNQPTTSNGSLDTSGNAAAQATGSVITDTVSKSTLGTYDATKRLTIPSTSGLSLNFHFFDHSADDGSGTNTDVAYNGRPIKGSSSVFDQDGVASGYTADVDIAVISSTNTSAGFTAALNAAINFNNNSSKHSGNFDIDSTIDGSNTSKVNLQADTVGTVYNQSIVKGSAHTMTVSGFSGGLNATNGSSINEFITISLGNSDGSSLVTKKFKFFPSSQILSGSTVSHSTGDVTTSAANGQTANGTDVVKVVVGGNATASANALATAINHNNGFGSGTASHNGSGVVTITSPNTHASNNQTNQALAIESEYTSDNIVSFSANPFDNFVAESTPTAFISITDSSNTTKRYKPSKGDNGESNGSTSTENGGVTFFINDASSTSNTADNLRAVIAGSSGHNGTINVSRDSSTVTMVAASAGQQNITSTGISSGLTLGSFSTNVRSITVGSGQADEISTGAEIFDNAGTLIGTVSSVTGDTMTLAADPATTVTSTIYTSQSKEALYIEQVTKVSCSFEKNTVTLMVNNVPVTRAKVNIGTFGFHASDCLIGKDGSNTNTQFMGELYEISMHRGATPSASITTLTPNVSETFFHYEFGD